MKFLQTMRNNLFIDFKFKLAVFIIADLLVVFDLATKFLADDVLKTKIIPVIDGFFNFALAYNTGVSFSMFNDLASGPIVLSTFAIVAALVLACLAINTKNRYEVVGYSLIYSGALANGIDRIINGHVIDFLDFYYKNWHYPTFNFADCFIFIGVAIILFDGFVIYKKQKNTK